MQENNLRAYYDMEEGHASNQLLDESGRSKHGTIEGINVGVNWEDH